MGTFLTKIHPIKFEDICSFKKFRNIKYHLDIYDNALDGYNIVES